MIARPWFQFSIRSLLIAMFLAAIWPAYHANKERRQRYAIAAIEKKGGEVRLQADGTVEYVFLPYVQADDLWPLAYLDSARNLVLTSGVFDSSMAPITGMGELESIKLVDMTATGDGLRLLARLPGLRHIDLLRIKLDEQDAVNALSDCKGLSEVTFDETKISEDRLKEVGKALPTCRVFISSGSSHGSLLNRFRLVRP